MNEPDSLTPDEQQQSWAKAVGNGVVVCLLLSVLLSVAAGYAFPDIVDGGSFTSTLFGIAIWTVSIGTGIWQVVRHRPRR